MIIIPKGNKSINIMIPKGYSDNITITDTSKVQGKTLNISENGEYSIKPDDGYYGLTGVEVNVSIPDPELEDITITENGTYKSDLYGYNEVIVNTAQPPLEDITITENGDYKSELYGYGNVSVHVQPELEDIEITENGSYKSNDYYGYGEVNVNVQPELEDITITENGEYLPEKDGFSKVNVAIPPKGLDIDLSSIGWSAEDVINYTANVQQDLEYTQSVMGKKSFQNDKKLVYAPVVTGITTCYYMFSHNWKLSYVPKLDVSNATSLGGMFLHNYSLRVIEDIENWNISNATSIGNMFEHTYNITSLDLSKWDTSKITNMSSIFSNSKSLSYVNLSNWDFSSCKTSSYAAGVYGMFQFGNTDGITVNLTNAKMSEMGSMTNMFYYCYLKEIILDGVTLPDINLNDAGFDASYSKLNAASIVGILNALPVTTKGNGIKLGTTNLKKITDEDKAIATGKGWTLS